MAGMVSYTMMVNRSVSRVDLVVRKTDSSTIHRFLWEHRHLRCAPEIGVVRSTHRHQTEASACHPGCSSTAKIDPHRPLLRSFGQWPCSPPDSCSPVWLLAQMLQSLPALGHRPRSSLRLSTRYSADPQSSLRAPSGEQDPVRLVRSGWSSRQGHARSELCHSLLSGAAIRAPGYSGPEAQHFFESAGSFRH